MILVYYVKTLGIWTKYIIEKLYNACVAQEQFDKYPIINEFSVAITVWRTWCVKFTSNTRNTAVHIVNDEFQTIKSTFHVDISDSAHLS